MSGCRIARRTIERLREYGLDEGWLRGIATSPARTRGSRMSSSAIQTLSYRGVIRVVGRVSGHDDIALWGPGTHYDALMKLLEARP